MTNMQVSYWAEQTKRSEAQEQKRANMERERETRRSNQAQEAEKARSNLAQEAETRRHNLEDERRRELERQETQRHQKRQDRSTTWKNVIAGLDVGNKFIQTGMKAGSEIAEAAKTASQLAFFS